MLPDFSTLRGQGGSRRSSDVAVLDCGCGRGAWIERFMDEHGGDCDVSPRTLASGVIETAQVPHTSDLTPAMADRTLTHPCRSQESISISGVRSMKTTMTTTAMMPMKMMMTRATIVLKVFKNMSRRDGI